MYWLQLTQASTGSKIYVNMELVVIVAPSRAGGASLVLTVNETVQKAERTAARIVPVRETQEEIMEMMSRGDGG